MKKLLAIAFFATSFTCFAQGPNLTGKSGQVNINGNWTQSDYESYEKLPLFIVNKGDTLDLELLERGTALLPQFQRVNGKMTTSQEIHFPAYRYLPRDNKPVTLTHKQFRSIMERLDKLEHPPKSKDIKTSKYD